MKISNNSHDLKGTPAMPKTITLPLLDALDYLYTRNLTIDKLWTERPGPGPPETHITTKPKHPKADPTPELE